MPDYSNYCADFDNTCRVNDYDNSSITCYTSYKNGRLIWFWETEEQTQERINKAKQLKEDKEKYPLFFWKENIK